MTYARLLAIPALMLAFAGSARGAPQLVEDQRVLERELRAARTEVKVIYELAASGSSKGLVERILAAENSESLTPTARDYLMHESLIALSAVEPDASARALVDRFHNRPVSSFVRLKHEHGNAIVPLYDLAAAARLTQRNWDVRSAEQDVAAALGNAAWRPQQLYSPRPEISAGAWRAGTIRAISNAEPAVLQRYRAALLDAQQSDRAYAGIVYAAARRLRDTDMYRALLASADDRLALQAVRSAGEDLPAGEAMRYLVDAVSRESIASAAILELGRLAAGYDEAWPQLFDLLGDGRHGASAALALSRQSSPEVLQALYDLITESADELASLRAALALRLSDSESAGELRARLLQQELRFARVVDALR